MSLGGFARRLLGKPDMEQSQRESYLSIIAQEARRLENIVDQAGAFSRLAPSRPEPVELGLIIDQSLEACRRRAAAAPGVACDAMVSEDIRRTAVRVDAALLITGLTKVIDNALESVVEAVTRGRNEKRLVRVGAEVGDRELVLEVSDTGCGIADEDAEFIFDPFFTTKPDHVGMGLTISKRIIEEHGGRIDFQTASGDGSRFQLVTPIERRRPERSRLL
ncbi:MAG: GHKL domain-containing protein, partial [Proteobacteria bacterium]|nr:GHKL domain-containing protein [Pseudomonadota bacterium]